MNNSLAAGAIDAMMDDKPVIEYAINQGQDLHIEMDGEAVGSFAFGVKKGSKYEHLVTEFNQALAEMKKDGSLDKIIKKWTASSSSAVPTTTTAAGLKTTPVKAKYIIASDSSFAPFVFQNSSNQFTGIDMDLIKAIAKDQGFKLKSPTLVSMPLSVLFKLDKLMVSLLVCLSQMLVRQLLTFQNPTTLPILSLVSKNQAPLLLMKI